MTVTNEPPVIIVGGGLAGLSCATYLHRAGIPALVLEGADRVGGRVMTDEVDGFLLDRGFQVFLTGYPAARELLDYASLELKEFYPGALVQLDGQRHRFADPWRRPLPAVSSIFAPVASFADALRIARLRADANKQNHTRDSNRKPTSEHLADFGLSQRVIDRFFRPFFGGVFLDRTLQTPSEFFRFVFRMFASSAAALPAKGMQAIPQQLADRLPTGTVRTGVRVASVAEHSVTLSDESTIEASAVVVATDAAAAAKFSAAPQATTWNDTVTIYFAATKSPLNEGILVLNGDGTGLVNHVCVPSDVAPNYAPRDRALISISVVDEAPAADDELVDRVRSEMRTWFGEDVDSWELLRVDRIPHALPAVPEDAGVREQDGIIFCGDYLQDPSINGAIASGREAAEKIRARQQQTGVAS